tara:strand:- start:1956 stop:3062 length:1107 start_codon:yes stop_codon:yes gene_type:complete
MRVVKSALIIAACAVLGACFHTSEPLAGFSGPFGFRHGTYTVDVIAEPTPAAPNGEAMVWTGTYGGQWVAVNEGFTGGMPLRNMRTVPMRALLTREMERGQTSTREGLAGVSYEGYTIAEQHEEQQLGIRLGDTGRDWRGDLGDPYARDSFQHGGVDGSGDGRTILSYLLVQIPAEDLRPYMRRLDPTLADMSQALPGFVYGIGILEAPHIQGYGDGSSSSMDLSGQCQQIRVVFPTCERVEADFRSNSRFVRAGRHGVHPTGPFGEVETHRYVNGRYFDSSTQGVLARSGMQQGLNKPLTCTPNSVDALQDVFSEYLFRNRTFSQPHLLLQQQPNISAREAVEGIWREDVDVCAATDTRPSAKSDPH